MDVFSGSIRAQSRFLRDIDASLGNEDSVIPGTRTPPFVLSMPQDMPIPVLIAVPHAGRSYPQQILNQMRHPAYAQLRLEDRYVDQLAVEIARQTGAGLLVANAPRAMLDLNRAPDDMDWSMIEGGAPKGTRHSLANRRARSGLGLVPRRLAGLGEIWTGPMARAELDARVRQIHLPYHNLLARTLDRIRDHWGAALLLDLHSMPPLKTDHADDRAAEFVIGDRFGASAGDRLVAGAIRSLAEQGMIVAHNRPYAGGYVLDRHAAPGRGIHGLQLEICRSLYLDGALSEPTEQVNRVATIVAKLVRTLGEDVAASGRANGLALAAE